MIAADAVEGPPVEEEPQIVVPESVTPRRQTVVGAPRIAWILETAAPMLATNVGPAKEAVLQKVVEEIPTVARAIVMLKHPVDAGVLPIAWTSETAVLMLVISAERVKEAVPQEAGQTPTAVPESAETRHLEAAGALLIVWTLEIVAPTHVLSAERVKEAVPQEAVETPIAVPETAADKLQAGAGVIPPAPTMETAAQMPAPCVALARITREGMTEEASSAEAVETTTVVRVTVVDKLQGAAIATQPASTTVTAAQMRVPNAEPVKKTFSSFSSHSRRIVL